MKKRSCGCETNDVGRSTYPCNAHANLPETRKRLADSALREAALSSALAKCRDGLGPDLSGRTLPELLLASADVYLASGGGPMEDCLRDMAQRAESALSLDPLSAQALAVQAAREAVVQATEPFLKLHRTAKSVGLAPVKDSALEALAKARAALDAAERGAR